MNQRYHHMATFVCRHNYFKEGIFRSIHFELGKESMKLMKDLGIVLKQFSGGFHLLALDPELLNSDTSDTSLKINLFCSDSLYINYTDLSDFTPVSQLFYFSNTEARSASATNFVLHTNEFVGTQESILYSNGSFSIPDFDADSTYTFKDVHNEEISSDFIRPSVNDAAVFNCAHLSEGIIKAYANGTLNYRVYHCPTRVSKKPFAVIELLTEVLHSNYKATDLATYEVNFNRRYTYWKYFLIDEVYQKFNNLSIIDKNEGLDFAKNESSELIQGREVIVFESSKKIPLLEHSEGIFQLINNYNSDSKSGKVIIKNLPFASADQLFEEQEMNNEHIYSHIYI